jgi:vitamin B12 transporter
MKTTHLSLIVAALVATQLHAEETLQDITVTTANKTTQSIQDTTSNITVITAEDIEEHGYQTVAEAVNRVSGLSVTSSGGLGQQTSLFVRGEDAGKVLVLLDGMRLNDPGTTDGRATIAHLTTDNVERIEIVKGGLSSIWGSNASAGVINIITKGAKKGLHADINVGYGSYKTKKASLHAAYDNDQFSAVLNASRLKTEGFSALLPRDAEADGYTNTSYNLKLGYRLDSHNRFRLYYNQIRYDVEYDNAFPANPNDAISKSKGKQKNYQAEYHFVYDNYTADLIASTGKFHRQYSYGNFDATLKEYSILNSLKYDNGKVILGLDYKDIDDGSIGAYVNKAVYLSNLYHLNDNTLLETNLRYDHFNKFDNKTTYKIGVKHQYDFLEGFTTSANYYTSYDAPSAYQITNAFNGNSLKPTYTKGFDLNAGYKHYLQLTYFNNKVQDGLRYVGVWPNSGYANVPGTQHYSGIEAKSTVNLGNFMLSGNYTHLIKFRDESGTNLNKRAKETLNIALDYYTEKDTHIGIDAQYVGDRKEFGQDTGNYTVWNLNYTTKVIENLHAAIHAKNIFDKDYQTTAGYSTEGRAIYMDLKYSF